jgi:hypothetical protein
MPSYQHELANRAACEVVNLHLDDKPPCERYQAVLRVFVQVLGIALEEQRESMLAPSAN